MSDKTRAKKQVASINTQYIDRVVDALELLCAGKRPDRALVVAWEENTSEELQSWAVCNAAAPWATGIGTIEAAQTMADTPEEGMGHQYREDAYPVDQSRLHRETFAADLATRISAAFGSDWTLKLGSDGLGSLEASEKHFFQFVGELDDLVENKLTE